MSYDLLITRTGASTPISRHTWLNLAIHSPALFLLTLHRELPEHRGLDHPAYGLSGHFERPILFWRDGEVTVKHGDDEFLSDLYAIARTLEARLVHPDGTDAQP